jgi:hypothetical protein
MVVETNNHLTPPSTTEREDEDIDIDDGKLTIDDHH